MKIFETFFNKRRRNVLFWGVATAALVGARFLSPNVFLPNVFLPNVFLPNVFLPNGFLPNGFLPNGFLPNGFLPNGFLPNGFLPNGFSPNGFESATRDFCGAPTALFAASQAEKTALSSSENERDDAKSPARLLLVESIERLEALRSLSANFDFESNLFGERYFGRGRYEEASAANLSENAERRRPLDQTRFRLGATTGKTSVKEALEKTEENVLEIVCDADRQSLWTYRSVENAKSLSHINIEELSNALARLDSDERNVLKENGVDKPCGANGLPGLGGLSGTLKSLGSVYRFDTEIDENVAPLNGTAVVQITGTMKSNYRQKLTRSLGVDVLEPYLAENIPTNVEITFGKSWPFPLKIQYFSISENEKKTRNDIFCVEFSSVVRNDASIRPENFNYNQPQITFDRDDAPYLERLVPGARL